MFLVCGEALWDLFACESAEGLTFDAKIGGSPFNVAVGLARFRQKSALLTGISGDAMGRRLAAALAREQVETKYLVETNQPTTLSLVDVGANGAPAYAFYGHDAADRAVRPSDLPALGPDVWGIHAGSYSLVVEPVGSSLLSLFQQEAGRRLITLDPNVRLNVEPDTALWRERIGRFAACADLIKVSDEDLDLIFPGATAAEIAGRWLDAGTGLVIITRGESGAEAFMPGKHLPVAAHQIDLADTVGAGDTFQAATITGLSELGIWSRQTLDAMTEDTLGTLLGFAAKAAAITCSRRGADLPHRFELPPLTA
jgi:fructokinase